MWAFSLIFLCILQVSQILRGLQGVSKAEYFIQDFNRLRYFHGEDTSQAYLIGVWIQGNMLKNGCGRKKG